MSSPTPFVPGETLALRQSAKWRTYDRDVLPLFVAEMDVALAEPVTDTLQRAIRLSDTGYAATNNGLAAAFAGFADRRWGWQIDVDQVSMAPDVSVAMVESLRVLIEPGDRVAFSPPIYPPFYGWVREVGGHVLEAPLAHRDGRWRLDLAAIEVTFRRGAKAYLLCNPHNPVGRVHSADEMRALAELADRYGVRVISDEIHAPLTLPGARFVPFLSVSEQARRCGVALASASKAWNLAGLKSAMIVTAHPDTRRLHARLPEELPWRTGHLGVLASTAAFTDGEPWLDEVLQRLGENRRQLADLLRAQLPAARYDLPEASYLAWIDVRALGWRDDPVADLVTHARVALSPGPAFGSVGRGFVRLNYACHPHTLREGVRRLAAYHAARDANPLPDHA
jgi:cystathionine beta-lyase